MSKTWKWILGIVLGLVVLAGVGFAAAYFFGFGHMAFRVGPAYAGHPMMDDYGFGNRAPMNGFRNSRGPMMGARGFGGYGFLGLPFLFFGGFLRLILPLGLLALVAYFSYRAGKKAGMNLAPVAPAPEPAIEAEPEEAPKQGGRKVA
jgi:hypothetical protein